jgi:hypothetical protein
MLSRLRPKTALPAPLRLAGRFLLGLAIGWLFHYILYRFSLPVQPFIYVNF